MTNQVFFLMICVFLSKEAFPVSCLEWRDSYKHSEEAQSYI